MPQQGVGQAQIALGVFEINWVDLVRHGAGANFAVTQFLLEVAQRNITPDVARPVDQDGIGAGYRVKQLGHVVVRLNLDAVGLELQAQPDGLGRLHHAPAEAFPIKVGPGRQVGVVIADSAIHLCQQTHAGNSASRGIQPRHHIGDLFADRGWTGRLAMGAAEHGHGGKGMCHPA